MKEQESVLVAALRKVSIFSKLEDKQLKTIAKGGTVLTYPAGKLIVEEGSPGVGFNLILEGRVKVRKGKKTLAELKDGDFFGEMSLFYDQPRTATVEAVTDTRCLGVTGWALGGMIHAHPDIALGMLKEMAGRLKKTSEAMTE